MGGKAVAYMMYNPQLETFLRVADAGSFNKAAERLYLSPPSVMKQVNALEKHLQLTLLERDSLVMTKRSKKAKSGFTEVDLIPLIARASVEERRDTIALDLVLRAQNPGLNPELIRAAFCQAYPDLTPDFVTFHRREVLDGEGKAFR